MATEQDYQKKITKTLEENNAYMVKVITASKKGVPDLVGCLPITKEMAMEYFKTHEYLGLFVAVEVKTPITMNNTSKLQEYNLGQINKAGGSAIVAWSTNAVEDMLGEIYGNND